MDKEARREVEQELLDCLKKLDVITPNYQGEVILHFSEGGLTDIDRVEKSIRRRFEKKLINRA